MIRAKNIEGSKGSLVIMLLGRSKVEESGKKEKRSGGASDHRAHRAHREELLGAPGRRQPSNFAMQLGI